jgi:hypothetical protein
MKNNQAKPDAALLWKQIDDELVPRLGLNLTERIVYASLLRHSRLEGQRQLRFSIPCFSRSVHLQFLRERHQERFSSPIRNLKSAPDNMQGYGFSMMALSALLVETIQSYRDGLPTTNPGELDKLRNRSQIPPPYRIPTSLKVNGRKAFQRFFHAYQQNFDGLSGRRFYKNIRNGLLHQGQTKGGWTLRKQSFIPLNYHTG